MKIGFIGQGWIGKNYADDFEKRGFEVIRYAQEAPHTDNKDKIKECDIVFIAVPTPTTEDGFDDSILREVVKLVGKGNIAVIKSTILPGTTESIQKDNPDIFTMHSPEFLREVNATYDSANPERNIVGYTEKSKDRAQEVLDVLPTAKYSVLVPVKEAELIKYAGNVFLYLKVLYANLLYDLSQSLDVDYQRIKEAVAADSRIGGSHLDPIHVSGHIDDSGEHLKTRGAGGHCFIKDFAAFREMYEKNVGDVKGLELLKRLEEKNIELLKNSGKDLDLLKSVYGK